MIQPPEVSHDALGGAGVDPISLDDLKVSIGLVASFDRRNAWEHGRCLRAFWVSMIVIIYRPPIMPYSQL